MIWLLKLQRRTTKILWKDNYSFDDMPNLLSKAIFIRSINLHKSKQNKRIVQK